MLCHLASILNSFLIFCTLTNIVYWLTCTFPLPLALCAPGLAQVIVEKPCK